MLGQGYGPAYVGAGRPVGVPEPYYIQLLGSIRLRVSLIMWLRLDTASRAGKAELEDSLTCFGRVRAQEI